MNIVLNNQDVRFTDKTIFCDSETIGLYGEVRLLQVYCPEESEEDVFVFDSVDYPELLMRKRLSEASKTVWHNGKYDFDVLKWIPSKEWEDTYILSTLVNFKEEKNALDVVATRVFGYDPYDKMFSNGMDVKLSGSSIKFPEDVDYSKKKMQKTDWGKDKLLPSQYAYAALDVFILPRVLASMNTEAAGWSYQLDKKIVTIFASMGQRLPIDVEGLLLQRKANEDSIDEIGLPINVNSYQQVRPYIGSNDSNDEGLANLCAEGNEKACQVRKVRSLRKQNSFITKFLDSEKDGYIYGHLNIGTRSGRSKCADQNLQQVPQVLKKYIKSTKYMIYADFAQLELRGLCALIGEPVLEKLFREKQDLHDYVRDSLFDENTNVSDAGRGNSLRQIAKIYNFASLYGAGWKQVGTVLTKYTGMMLSERELKVNAKKWKDTFPGIRKWHNENIRHWQAGRTLMTPMGRRYIGKLPTDTNNIMNQGFGGEVAKLALVYMDQDGKVPMKNMGMFVHDSYTSEEDELDSAKQVAESMADCMSRAWHDICQSGNVKLKDLPMPINVYIGKDWKTIDAGKDDGTIAEYKLEEGVGTWLY